MPYSFVRLYLFKCDVCVLNYIWINPKKKIDHFICIWKWFLSLFVFMFSAYIVFHCLYMFCVEKQVSEFFTTHSRLTRQSWNFSWFASCETPITSSFRSFRDSLVTQLRLAKIFTTCFATRPIVKRPKTTFLRAFRGKLVLNLSHPLLNPFFNIFTSKLNQFEWFFHSLTSLRYF